MIDIKSKIARQLYRKEISKSNFLHCPGVAGRPSDSLSKEELIQIQKDNNLILPNSLIEFYQQMAELTLSWKIVDESFPNGKEREAVFREDSWIKKHYLEKDYSWEAVRILLSGGLNIPEVNNILDIEFVKATGMYDAAEKVGLNGGDLRPIDTNEFATACMKVENGKLIDNVYLYTGFGGLPTALHNMEVTFEQYLELAYKSKCFNYWNLVYCLKNKVPNYELMKKYFPVIFPHLEPDLVDFGITYSN